MLRAVNRPMLPYPPGCHTSRCLRDAATPQRAATASPVRHTCHRRSRPAVSCHHARQAAMFCLCLWAERQLGGRARKLDATYAGMLLHSPSFVGSWLWLQPFQQDVSSCGICKHCACHPCDLVCRPACLCSLWRTPADMQGGLASVAWDEVRCNVTSIR